MDTFGQRLKYLRNKKEMTGEELGKKLNVTKVAISKWESDSRSPDKDTLIKLAKEFDVTTDYLLCLTDDPKAYVVIKEEMPKELKELGVEKIVHTMKEKNIPADKILKIIEMIEDIEKGSL